MEFEFSFGLIAEKKQFCDKHQYEYTARRFSCDAKNPNWSSCPLCRTQNEREQRQKEFIQWQAAQKQQTVEKLFTQSAIPERFSECDFDNYIADTGEQLAVKNTMLEFVKNIGDNLKLGRNVILAGNAGNGKTHLSIATAKAATNAGYPALFTTVGEMIDKINEAGWAKAKVIDNYTVPDLLILDEVTYTLNNEEQKTLFKVINKRYEKVRSTIIQTNLSIADLKNVLGERIVDRLRENGGIVLYFTWESYRK